MDDLEICLKKNELNFCVLFPTGSFVALSDYLTEGMNESSIRLIFQLDAVERVEINKCN